MYVCMYVNEQRSYQLLVDGIRLLLALQGAAEISLTRVGARYEVVTECHLQTTSSIESAHIHT